VKPIVGVDEVIRNLREAGQPICVASQGPPEKMFVTLSTTGLLDYFEGRIFSAKNVSRAKPFPDLFLHAATQCGVDPARCAVIEDTSIGMKAGVAAGMQVFGFCPPSDAWIVSGCGARPFHRMEDLPGLLATDR
jgi:HAD superfamily hydrolase (TIGR01509 family)